MTVGGPGAKRQILPLRPVQAGFMRCSGRNCHSSRVRRPSDSPRSRRNSAHFGAADRCRIVKRPLARSGGGGCVGCADRLPSAGWRTVVAQQVGLAVARPSTEQHIRRVGTERRQSAGVESRLRSRRQTTPLTLLRFPPGRATHSGGWLSVGAQRIGPAVTGYRRDSTFGRLKPTPQGSAGRCYVYRTSRCSSSKYSVNRLSTWRSPLRVS